MESKWLNIRASATSEANNAFSLAWDRALLWSYVSCESCRKESKELSETHFCGSDICSSLYAHFRFPLSKTLGKAYGGFETLRFVVRSDVGATGGLIGIIPNRVFGHVREGAIYRDLTYGSGIIQDEKRNTSCGIRRRMKSFSPNLRAGILSIPIICQSSDRQTTIILPSDMGTIRFSWSVLSSFDDDRR
jgi:hypothetical protein